jgi:hypothetical protein
MCVAPSSVLVFLKQVIRPFLKTVVSASSGANHQYSCGCGETVPQFTFSFSAGFVNVFSRVSTGFLRVFPIFAGFWTVSGGNIAIGVDFGILQPT